MDLEVLGRILDGREKPTNLSFELLKNITENFSDDREIGHGGFATVYKGVLPNGNVAVKRIKNSHSINETFFYREVDSLLNIEHKNVVRFLGFCASTDQTAIQIKGSKQHIYAEVRERLLCFEYISNGSLQKYITDELRGLEWNTRYKIIRGICEGLHHLHKEKQIYHMDLKPDNILLDNDMAPKITDFGLSRLDEKSKTMSEERHGSLGYCAPEYLHQGKMSFKSDMYSLGVIIIELVTGQKAIPNNNNNVLRRWRHRWKKTGNGTPLVYQEVAKCLEIGLLCQEIDPFKRPYIWDMIHVIREIEGANEKISNAYEHTFGQISPYSEDDMLGIEPLQLHFPFELNKQMSCALQLTNETGSYIAFDIKNTSPLAYCIQPQKGIMPPQSMCSVEITMQLQGKTPGYMHRASELIVWSTKVNDCLAVENITTNMFINEAVNVVDDVNLDVVFDVSEPQEASEETSVAKPIVPPEKRYSPPPRTSTPTSATPYSVASLQQYTSNFREENVIRESRLGKVFLAKLPEGKLLEVMKIDNSNGKVSVDDFLELVALFLEIKHPSILELVGYCAEYGQRLLVYNHFSRKTLDDALHDREEIDIDLSWSARLKVALSSGLALEYLHERFQPPIVHQNFEPFNVLLDNKLSVCVAECGLAVLMPSSSVTQLSGRLRTLLSYDAPEFQESGIISERGDVYSFGVVMLELLTGRKPYDSSRPRHEQHLVRWAVYQFHDIESLSKMVDPSIRGQCSEKVLSQFADIISRCIQREPEFRPPMSAVVQDITSIVNASREESE